MDMPRGRLWSLSVSGRVWKWRHWLFGSTAVGALLAGGGMSSVFGQTAIEINTNRNLDGTAPNGILSLDGSASNSNIIVRGAIVTGASGGDQAISATLGTNALTLTNGAIIRGGDRTGALLGNGVSVDTGAELSLRFENDGLISGGRGKTGAAGIVGAEGGYAIFGSGKLEISGFGRIEGGPGGGADAAGSGGGKGGDGISLSSGVAGLTIGAGSSVTVRGGARADANSAGVTGAAIRLTNAGSLTVARGASLYLFPGTGGNATAGKGGGIVLEGTIGDRIGGGGIVDSEGGTNVTPLAVNLSGNISGGDGVGWRSLIVVESPIPTGKAILLDGRISSSHTNSALLFSSVAGASSGGELQILPGAEIFSAAGASTSAIRVNFLDPSDKLTIWNRGSLRVADNTGNLILNEKGGLNYVQEDTSTRGVIELKVDDAMSFLKLTLRGESSHTGSIKFDVTDATSMMGAGLSVATAKGSAIIYAPSKGKQVTLQTAPLTVAAIDTDARLFMAGDANDVDTSIGTRVTGGGRVVFDGFSNIIPGEDSSLFLAGDKLPVFATGDVHVRSGTLHLRNAAITGYDSKRPIAGALAPTQIAGVATPRTSFITGTVSVADGARLEVSGRVLLRQGGLQVAEGGELDFQITGRQPGNYGYIDLSTVTNNVLQDTLTNGTLDPSAIVERVVSLAGAASVTIRGPVESRVFPLIRFGNSLRSLSDGNSANDSIGKNIIEAALSNIKSSVSNIKSSVNKSTAAGIKTSVDRRTALYEINIRKGGLPGDDPVLGLTGAIESARLTEKDIVAEVRRRPDDALGVTNEEGDLLRAASRALGADFAVFDRLNNAPQDQIADLVRDLRPNVSGGEIMISLSQSRRAMRSVAEEFQAEPRIAQGSADVKTPAGTGVSGAGEGDNSYRGWVRGGALFSSGSKRNGTGGYEGTGYQLATGVDTNVTGLAGRARLGFSYAYGSSTTEGKGRSATDSRVSSHLLSVYSGVRVSENDAVGLAAVLGVGLHNIEGKRKIDGFGRTAHSASNATSAGLDIDASYAVRDIAANLVFEPMFGIEVSHVNLSGFDETGAGVLNHTADNTQLTSIRSRLGGVAAYMVGMPEVGELRFSTSAIWMHDFDTQQRLRRRIRFRDGPYVDIGQRKLGSEEFIFAASMAYTHKMGVTASFGYSGALRGDESAHGFSGEMQYKF